MVKQTLLGGLAPLGMGRDDARNRSTVRSDGIAVSLRNFPQDAGEVAVRRRCLNDLFHVVPTVVIFTTIAIVSASRKQALPGSRRHGPRPRIKHGLRSRCPIPCLIPPARRRLLPSAC